jgi:hypothetical protein
MVILLSFILEIFLSSRKSKWLGLIIPVVFFVSSTIFLVLNLKDAFSVIEGYGIFLTEHGSAGFFALILKIGFIYTPVLIQLIIYFICRHYYKKRNGPAKDNKELKKMIVDDLN